MTAETKKKAGSIFNAIYKAVVLAFVSLCLITVPKYLDRFESLTFDTHSDKANTKNLVETVTPYELEKLKKHTTDPGVHMPKEAKDSVYVTRLEYEELIKNSAVDQYNMKRGIDEILATQKSIKRTMDIIGYRIDRIEKQKP